jgi:phosphoglycerol transferase MdoB-like AlkP superfamily enzyme
LDEHLESFAQTMEKLGLDQTTELVIFGDHLTMGGDIQDVLGAERNLVVFFPFRKQDDKWKRVARKQMTYYDVAPTVMELLMIDYNPPFPFGADMFGPETGPIADVEDLKLIYGIVTGDVDATTAHCHGQSGFCRANEY